MGEAFLYGNGGQGALQLRVLGGQTAPEHPREGTVWVKTTEKITGWAIGAEVPENPADGTVWIFSGQKGSVACNVLRKNQITVFPGQAQRYTGGKWENAEASLYTGGTWVQFSWDILWLYKSDADFETVTGGWSSGPYHHLRTGSTSKSATVTQEENCMSIKFPSASGGSATSGATRYYVTVFANNPIDITAYQKLEIIVDSIDLVKKTYLLLTEKRESKFTPAAIVEFNAAGTYSIDVSQLTGEYYIGINDSPADQYGSSTVKITQISLV